MMSKYFAQVQKLYDAGARNFLFINVPAFERSPLMAGQGSSRLSAETAAIKSFNSALASSAASFKANHAGVSFWVYDSYSAFTTLLNSPTKYGFKDATTYGQSGSFWGDSLHPASAAHVILGKQVGDLLAGTPW
jgi:phospholipase/lecithinase/hemolysin